VACLTRGNAQENVYGRSSYLSRRTTKSVASRTLMGLDALESRRLLTSTLDGAGLLTIDGTSNNDDISLAIANNILTVSLNGSTDGAFDLSLAP